jgi:hypothetical protein
LVELKVAVASLAMLNEPKICSDRTKAGLPVLYVAVQTVDFSRLCLPQAGFDVEPARELTSLALPIAPCPDVRADKVAAPCLRRFTTGRRALASTLSVRVAPASLDRCTTRSASTKPRVPPTLSPPRLTVPSLLLADQLTDAAQGIETDPVQTV